MTNEIFEEHINSFKKGIIDSITEKPDNFLYGFPSVVMKAEHPETKEISVAEIEGLNSVFDNGFITLPGVLAQIFEEIPPLAIALISHITLPGNTDLNNNNDIHSEALFVQIETYDKECTICWEIIDDGITSLNNVFNPEFKWRNKIESNEDLITKPYIYIEPEL